MVMLGGGADILRAVVVPGGGYDAWPELVGRIEQRVAQVLQQAEPVLVMVRPRQLREARSRTAQT